MLNLYAANKKKLTKILQKHKSTGCVRKVLPFYVATKKN